jgi:uncharacterized membrane protein YphA (DoxX/SURF4 family)
MRPAGVLWHVARLLAAAVWLLAAAGKLLDPVKFMGSIDAYALLPPWAVIGAALTMPGIELALGLALLSNVKVRSAALLANLLMLAFIAAIGSAMWRGLELDCGCFDLLPIGPSQVGWGTIGRDVLMMIPTIWLAFWEQPKR